LDESGGSADQTLSELIPDKLNLHPDRDPNFDRITVAQLITHTSGLHIPHVSRMGGVLIESFENEQKDRQLDFIILFGLSAEPGSAHEYANSNYLLLGLVIESVTGKSYANYCKQKLLQPLGIESAQLSPSWAFLSSYGGWEISAEDYLRYANAYYKTDTILSKPAEAIAAKLPRTDIMYTLGMLTYTTDAGRVYWHSGSFNWRSATTTGDFGAFYAAYDNGFAVVANIDTNLNDGVGIALDSALFRAANR